MKEKIIDLTTKLHEAGFIIEGLEVEASDIVRFKFRGLKGLELLVNESYAKIEEGSCSKQSLEKLVKLLKKVYILKDEINSIEDDMYHKLANAF
ncbi:MAG: hypothetical protein ACTSSH_07245 [Candidatus Heimdallarchaeota archaeon]